ncbi:MAG: DUF2779 domain-containing protein [Gallionellaceae bacterium]|jgi:hypothetical protein|nr:DUF2779 domain-containing protein [Gallionellaceae bacterium]
MKPLSKSKLIAWRQCPKRLWLEIHHPELREDSAATEKSYAEGNQIGELARQLYDPKGKGELVDFWEEGMAAAFARTQTLLQGKQPIFEAGLNLPDEGVRAFADIMLPVRGGRWRMVEVKSSASVKDYHRDDAAIQTYIAQKMGIALTGVALACVDSSWVYPGGGDYDGLLVEHDLTDEAMERADEVEQWIKAAHTVAAKRKAPNIATGDQCGDPYECGFYNYCSSQEPQAEYPVEWLPRRSKKIKETGASDMREVSDDLLNETQLRVKHATLSGEIWFDGEGAAEKLAAHKLPAYFLDFETIRFTVPIWKGTRPYQQIPFQFSVQKLSRNGKVTETPFLDLSGDDPSRALAEALIDACGTSGPIFAYNAKFEAGRIADLAARFPKLKKPLLALNDRLVDLLPIAQAHYYHPSQQGSWSIKSVLPALCPDLSYDDLEGVQHGGMAMEAYLEAIAPETAEERRQEIEEQLLAYCGLDTWAMVRIWEVFKG